jgi:superfamily II DNA or RNA helicase
VKLVLDKQCTLTGASPKIISMIKNALTMKNPAYIEAKKRGRWTGNIDKTLQFYESPVVHGPSPGISFPRGFIRGAINITGKDFTFQDDRRVLPSFNFTFTGELRAYQDEALTTILKKDFGVLDALMGSGKTVIALAVIVARRQPTLILVHNKELLYQWRDRIATFLGVGAGLVGDGKFDIQPITVAIINTAKKYLKSLPDYFGQVVVDECFVAGTLVDGVPIEKIQVGDFVDSYNHVAGIIEKKKVLQIFRHKRSALFSVKIQGKEPIVCTKNHPFYTPHGYLTADKLTSKLSVLCIDSQLINLENSDAKGSYGKLLRLWKTYKLYMGQSVGNKFRQGQGRDNMLSWKVFYGSQKEKARKGCNFFTKIQQKVCIRAHEKEQSNVRSCHCGENENRKKSKWHVECLAWQAWWQWTTYTISNSFGCVFGLADGGSYQDRPCPGRERISDKLQSRYRKRKAEDSNRSGRQGTQLEKEKVTRSEKRTKTQWLRVESVEIYKRASDERPSNLSSENYVYNLEVEGNNNYFVDGVLVHNCHRTPSTMFSEVVRAFDCKYMLGLSATPYRRDGLTSLIGWFIGEMVYRIDPKELQDSGAVLIPEIQTRETGFHYQKLLSLIVADEDRNNLIVRDILFEVKHHPGTALVVSDRVEHCQILQEILKKKPALRVEILAGKLTKGKKRTSLVEDIRKGKVNVVIATVQLIGEGFDCPGLSSLFLATPIKFSGRLIQVVGRILRPADGKKPRVYDYQDPVGPLFASAKSRGRVYKEMGWVK